MEIGLLALASSPRNLCRRNAASAKKAFREHTDSRDSDVNTIATDRLHMEKVLQSCGKQSTALNLNYQDEVSRETICYYHFSHSFRQWCTPFCTILGYPEAELQMQRLIPFLASSLKSDWQGRFQQ